MKQIKLFITSIFIIMTMIHSPMVTADNSTKHYAIQKLLVDEANRQRIDPALALAIAKVESNFNPQALSHAGAKGIMQIMPATAEGVFGVSSEQLFDAKINIHLGISFIKQLLERYNQRTDIALSHYNGGSAVRDKSGRLSVIPATKKYVNKVLSAQEQFKYRAYHLSSNSPKATIKSHPVDNSIDSPVIVASINILEQKKAVFNPRSTVQPKAKNIIKPVYLSGPKSFDKSRYEKVEQLRALRLHNIMRNTKSTTLVNNTTRYADKKLTQIKMRTPSKQNIPLSEKRIKVLSWEKMFN